MANRIAQLLSGTLTGDLPSDDNIGSFKEIADTIVGAAIVIDGTNKSLVITEIEFYLTDDNHRDPFTHKDELQATPAQFYFHRQNGKSFKGGTYKGLDITFRIRDTPTFGGILIRSCLEVPTDKYYGQEPDDGVQHQQYRHIEGPCNVVNCLLALAKVESIQDLVHLANLTSGDMAVPLSNKVFTLREPKTVVKYDISPRVGLTLKKSTSYNDMHVRYIMRPYRCTIDICAFRGTAKIKTYKCLQTLARYVLSDDPSTSIGEGEYRTHFRTGSAIYANGRLDENRAKELYDVIKTNGITTVKYLCMLYGYWCAMTGQRLL